MPDFDEEALAEAYNGALELEKAGRFDEAAELYRRALLIDPADHGGAAVRLASMGKGATPEKAPDAYVMTLFDQHAEVFDSVLVDQLGYGVPAMLGALMPELLPEGAMRLLDLGCGTGLVGDALYEHVDHATGVDLSERMIELADEREVYDELFVSEAVHFLMANETPAFDLIVAADVLPYMGRLEKLFEGFARNAPGGGLIAFSSETAAERDFDGADYRVGAHQRFAHRLEYLDRLMGAHGFVRLIAEEIAVRHERGEPVPGHLVVARRVE